MARRDYYEDHEELLKMLNARDARVAELEANHQKYRAVVEGEFVDYERQIAELEAERDRLREALGGELPTAPFGDILGHNYWMDVNTLRRLWRRMAAAALAAKEVDPPEAGDECPDGCGCCSGEYCDTHGHEPCDCDVADRHAAKEVGRG